MTRFRKLAASLSVSAVLVAGAAAPAGAQTQDGLVNVAIGDITLEDINVGVAAQIAANVCCVKVGPVAVLGRAVDRSGETETICEAGGAPVTIEQN